MDEDLADTEALLRVVAAIRDLARSEHLSEYDRIAAIERACVLVMGSSAGEAEDFLEQVTLGLPGPG
jgi:hypothetical protein